MKGKPESSKGGKEISSDKELSGGNFFRARKKL